MARQNWFERLAAGLAILSIGMVVSGTRACQEDYDLGSQANLRETPTVTPDDDDGDDTTTPTPAGTATPRGTIAATETPEPEDTEVPTPRPAGALGEASGSAGMLEELQNLSEKDPSSSVAAGSQNTNKPTNWLGRSRTGDDSEKTDPCLDSDGDGFTDSYEKNAATDENDSSSAPPAPDRNLIARFKNIDTDMDGLADSEDPNPAKTDTDGDGLPDGAEVLSGGNPREAGDQYPDADGDGLSDSFEDNRGTDSQSKDTDGDGLNDAEEQAIGSNPTMCDTDGDGLLDGAEVHLFQSDPTRGAAKRRVG